MITVPKKECPYCNKMISNSNYQRHVTVCETGKYTPKLEKYKQDDDLYHCPVCIKTFHKIRQLDGHIRLAHEKKYDINKGFKDGTRISWCKGKTKETDIIVKQIGNTLKQGYDSGRIIPHWKGKKIPKVFCDKMSKTRKQLLKDRPELHPNFRLANNRIEMSYPEKLVFDKLTDLGILFEHQYRIGKYWTDFLLVHMNTIVEVDGKYWHSSVEQKKHDMERDKFIQSNGFNIVHIPAKNVLIELMKLVKEL